MKIQVSTKDLKAAMARLGSLPGVKSDTAILQITADEFGGLLLKRATTNATGETSAPAKIMRDGAAAIDLRYLQQAVHEMTGDLTIEEGKNCIMVNCGKQKARIATVTGEEFIQQDLPSPRDGPFTSMRFEAVELVKSLKMASKAAMAATGGKDKFIGVSFLNMDGRLLLFGVDGRRMHGIDLGARVEPITPDAEDNGLLIATESLTPIIGTFGDARGAISIYVGERSFDTACGDTWIRQRMSAVAPVNPKAFLIRNDFDVTLKFNRAEIIKAVKTAETFGYGSPAKVMLDVSEMGAEITSDNHAGSSYNEDVTMSGQVCKIAFGSTYMINILECLEAAEVTLSGNMREQFLCCREGNVFVYLALMKPDLPE